MAVRLIIFVSLLVLGALFTVMGIKSQPYKLKKSPVRITFRKNIHHELEKELATISSAKTELAGTVIWAAMAVLCIFLIINGVGNPVYVVSSCFGMCYTFYLAMRKIILYENAVVMKTILGRKVWFLDEIDEIVSYNIVNSFNRGVSYGYKLRLREKDVCSIPKNAFKGIDIIEEVYKNSRYINEFNT